MDSRLEYLRREAELKPDDEMIQIAYYSYRARFEGEKVYLEDLMDFRKWQKSNKFIQNQIIGYICNVLPKKFVLTGIRNWKCENVDLCENCIGIKPDICRVCKGYGKNKTTVNFRLPLFKHTELDMEFSLIPGDGNGIKPFLMSRYLFSYKNYYKSDKSKDSSHKYTIKKQQGRLHNPYRAEYKKVEKIAKKLRFSLPNREEWIHAAQGGTDTSFYWGNDFNQEYVWSRSNTEEWFDSNRRYYYFEDINPYYNGLQLSRRNVSSKIHDKQKKYNAYGLVDVIGNEFEWVTPDEFLMPARAGYEGGIRENAIVSIKDSIDRYDRRSHLSWRLPCASARFIKRLF